MTAAEALELIEAMADDSDGETEVNQDTSNVDVVLFPPNENAYLTDEDSDDENQGDGDPNHIGRRMMNTEVELTGISDDVNKSYINSKSSFN